VLVHQAEGGRSKAVAIYSATVRLPLFDTFAEGGSRPVRVLEWPDPNRRRPSRYWITSFSDRRVAEVLTFLRARAAAQSAVAQLQEHCGALDFEGRSFPGWHHHMTMASAAYAYQGLRGHDRMSPGLGA
jgi:hypothetical protein